MLRYLKKRIRSSKDLAPPASPTRQNTGIGAECDGDSEGEHCSKDLRADVANGTDLTIAPDINHGGGSRITNQDSKGEGQQPPAHNASAPTPRHEGDNAGECGWL